jgi:uncharacterized protein YoxC
MAEDKLDKISKKLDGVADDVRTANYRIDKIEAKIDSLTDVVKDLSGTVKTMSGQLGSALGKVMEHEERLDSVESRVSVIEAGRR